MHVPLTHRQSIFIDTAPTEVYSVVSDVTRTGEWSPVCVGCWWSEGDGPEVGARFTGRNLTPDRTWTTTSVVVAADPGREFAWSVGPDRVRWGYLIEPSGSGTLLTETWEFTATGRAFFEDKYGAAAPGEIAARQRDARTGIPATLVALKAILEA